MKIEPIPDDLIDWVLGAASENEVPEQVGPLRHFDKEMRCASRGCGSSTYYKMSGTPRCMTHALRELNLIAHGAYPERDWRYR